MSRDQFPTGAKREMSVDQKYCLRSKKCSVNDGLGVKKRKRMTANDENASPSKTGEELPAGKVRKLVGRKALSNRENKSTADISNGSLLQEVKACLHSSIPCVMKGRGQEVGRIEEFLWTHLDSHAPGSLYISGPPGTGKTAAVTKLIQDNPKLAEMNISTAIINCMRLSTPSAVYERVYRELVCKTGQTRKTDTERRIVKKITTSPQMIVLVLDEIDQLTCSSQQVLYSIFEWPSLRGSSLILISIANSLDLTDRVLPRLRSNPKTCPELMHFSPYNKDEIVAIIDDRLHSTTVIDKMAVQFCASKVAAVNGDIRTALDICRRGIELVESTRAFGKEGDPVAKVTVGHIAKVVEEVYGRGPRHTVANDEFPIQQKLTACSVLIVMREGVREPTLEKLYGAYVSACGKKRLKQESTSEFVNLLNMLEVKGVVSVKPSKRSPLLSKVQLLLQQDELTRALKDESLISSILQTT